MKNIIYCFFLWFYTASGMDVFTIVYRSDFIYLSISPICIDYGFTGYGTIRYRNKDIPKFLEELVVDNGLRTFCRRWGLYHKRVQSDSNQDHRRMVVCCIFRWWRIFLCVTVLLNSVRHIPYLIIYKDRVELYVQLKANYDTIYFADVQRFRLIK